MRYRYCCASGRLADNEIAEQVPALYAIFGPFGYLGM